MLSRMTGSLCDRNVERILPFIPLKMLAMWDPDYIYGWAYLNMEKLEKQFEYFRKIKFYFKKKSWRKELRQHKLLWHLVKNLTRNHIVWTGP